MAVTGTTIVADALNRLRETQDSDIAALVTGGETGPVAIVAGRDTNAFGLAAINEAIHLFTTPSPLNCIAVYGGSTLTVPLDGSTPGVVALSSVTPLPLNVQSALYNGVPLSLLDQHTVSLYCPGALSGADVRGESIGYMTDGVTFRLIPTPEDGGSHSASIPIYGLVAGTPISALANNVVVGGLTDTQIRYLFGRYVAVQFAKGDVLAPELQDAWPIIETELYAYAEQLYQALPLSVRDTVFREGPRQAKTGQVSGPKRRKMEEA